MNVHFLPTIVIWKWGVGPIKYTAGGSNGPVRYHSATEEEGAAAWGQTNKNNAENMGVCIHLEKTFVSSSLQTLLSKPFIFSSVFL